MSCRRSWRCPAYVRGAAVEEAADLERRDDRRADREAVRLDLGGVLAVVFVYGSVLSLVREVTPVAKVCVFVPAGPTHTKALHHRLLAARLVLVARALGQTAGVLIPGHVADGRTSWIVGPLVQVVVPTRRQRMKASHFVSHDPVALSRAE